MIKVFTAGSIDEAVLVHGLLVDAGIPAVLHDALPDIGPIGSYSFGSTVWICDEKDEELARGIIRRNQPTPRNCATCGYDLTGLPEARCPECGEPFVHRISVPDWTCPNCGEEMEGQFTNCWKCGASRPETQNAT